MKKITLKACALLLVPFLAIGVLNAQLNPVETTGLPNVGRGQIKFADFNNDGKLDALVVGQTAAYNTTGGTIGLYLGNGDGTFTNATSTWFASELTPVSCGILALADYDKDGKIDFCYAGYASSSSNIFRLYRNTGTGFENVTSTAFTTAPVGCYTGSIEWGDIDNDGDLDLLIQGRTFNSLAYPGSSTTRGAVTQLFKNNNNGTFTSAPIPANNVCYGQMLLADLDLDGDLDYIFSGGGNIGGQGINDGTGTFTNTSYSGTSNLTRGSNMAYGDFNKDGKVDYIQSYINSSSTPLAALKLSINTTSTAGSYTSTASTPSGVTILGTNTTYTNSGIVSAIDYDGDGDLDFTIHGLNGTVPTTLLYLNGGENGGTPTFTAASLSLTGLHYGDAVWADLNNDNLPDLITFGYTDATATVAATKIYLNGTAITNMPPLAPTSISAVGAAIASLSWVMPENADDRTPNTSLTYNVRIGTTPGSSNIMKANIYGPGKYMKLSTVVNGLADGNYYWSVQAVDAANVAGAWSEESTFTIGSPTTLPTVQASNITASSKTTSSINLTWTNGDGYKTAVFMKVGNNSVELAEPVVNTVYTANTAFGSGTQIGTSGWYCVFNNTITPNTSSSVNITDLSAFSNYQFMSVSYNSKDDNSIINYLGTAGTNNPAVISSADYSVPTVITSALTINSTTVNSVVVTPGQSGTTGWNGPYATVVFIKQGTDATEDVSVVANSTYIGNATFGEGSQVGNWYCVYNGNSSYQGSGAFNPFPTFSGLSENTSYIVRACTYNGTPGLEKYSATAVATFTTSADVSTGFETASSNLQVYPVLTRGTLHISGNGVERVQVCSLAGHVVKSVVKPGDATVLNITDLASGAYLVKVTLNDGSSKVQKVLLNK